MRQLFFEEQHQAFWRTFEQDLQQLEKRRGSLSAQKTALFMQDYRTVCHHLAVATDRCYSGGLTDYLQYLCERAHQLLYVGQQVSLWVRCRDFVMQGFPQLVRREKKLVWLAHALFYLPFIVAFLLTAFYPDSVDKIEGLQHGPQLADSYKEMLDQYSEGTNREAKFFDGRLLYFQQYRYRVSKFCQRHSVWFGHGVSHSDEWLGNRRGNGLYDPRSGRAGLFPVCRCARRI